MDTTVKINGKVNSIVVLPAFETEIKRFLELEQISDYSFVSNDTENQNIEILSCNQ